MKLSTLKKFAFLLPLFAFIFLLFISKPEKTIIVPEENVSQTKSWKTYKNVELNFSFKYPEGLLTNFRLNTSDTGTTTLKKVSKFDKEKNPNHYNVIFEASSIQSNLSISDFIDTKLSETKNLKRQKIKLKNNDGFHITNVEKKADAYFIYNIFKHSGAIYNFAIFSDDPVLVKANENLLNQILTTVTFN